jgi:hypothetical protein
LDLLPDLIGQKIDRGQRLGRPRRHQDLIQRRVDEIGRIGGFQRRKAGLDLLDEQLGQGLGQIPLRRAFEDHADQEPGLTRRLGLVQGKDDLRLGQAKAHQLIAVPKDLRHLLQGALHRQIEGRDEKIGRHRAACRIDHAPDDDHATLRADLCFEPIFVASHGPLPAVSMR